ncbi:glucose-induced degradation protein [Acrasis kona]|uniref:Glucose-induced degradation protein n=1 Tax=Acrasis kona TaxID=1008807 RepID=A0AAW2YLC4_9EUKA
MSNPKRTVSKEEWEKKLKQVKINKSDINKLIMNYFVVEGYKDAAEMFQKESNTPTLINLESITDRVNVRNSVQSGEIEKSIEQVNDLNPEILDNNSKLYFRLQQQQLIEMIRAGKLDEALQFATEELAPRGEENKEFLDEIEKTMSLLAFADMSDSPVSQLLESSQRQKTASELNAAILESQCQETAPKLPTLLKMLMWAQKRLDEKLIYPRINDLQTAELVVPNQEKK